MPPKASCQRGAPLDLAHALADVGLVQGGSLVRRYTRCTNPNCRCRADPPRLHGPYWQWSAKVDGKTVSRRLSEREAALYAEWIANDRRLRQLISQMRQVAGEVTQLILQQDQVQAAPPRHRSGVRERAETVHRAHITPPT
ncbi:MAG: DUF6788 family protein [Candidatus Dormibacteria bacterium]